MSQAKQPRLFEEGHPVSEYFLDWWESLKKDKGDRSELRRSKNLQKLQLTSAFQRCYWGGLKHFAQKERKPSKKQMATIIGLAAYIEKNDIEKKDDQSEKQEHDYFGYQIGRGEEKPKLSELRFRRLLKIKDREKLYRFLIQVIRLLDNKVNLLDLMRIAYFWGNKGKVNLSYKYYEMVEYYNN